MKRQREGEKGVSGTSSVRGEAAAGAWPEICFGPGVDNPDFWVRAGLESRVQGVGLKFEALVAWSRV